MKPTTVERRLVEALADSTHHAGQRDSIARFLTPVVRELQAEELEAAADDLRQHGVGPEVFVVDERAERLRGAR